MELSRALVDRVRPAVERHARRTPLLASAWLSDASGARVWLKCENLQLTGSFKLRGALAALSLLTPEERAGGVFTCSTGNHGQGLAFAAREEGVGCTVVVPRGASEVKCAKMSELGARIVEAPGEGYDEALAWTFEHADELGGRYVSAFEDPAISAGNGGTTALEIFEERPGVDTLLVPTGGAGLVVGMGVVARDQSHPVRVVAVNPERSAAFARSWHEGRAITSLPPAKTLADGVEGGTSAVNFELARELVDDVVVVTEEAIASAMRETLAREALLVEGSAAMAVAALLEGDWTGREVALVLTGGNVDAETLRTVQTVPGRN